MANLRNLINKYTRFNKHLKQGVIDVHRKATLAAINVATNETPYEGDGKPRGENATTGRMRDNWALDSVAEPKVSGNIFETELNNTADYSSFVNDGHIVDIHFVPHLFFNNVTGLLDKLPDQDGGIVVGTQTQYIQGLYMTEHAIEEWEKIVHDHFGRGVLTYAISKY